MTGQETFEFAYVLAGLALASTPILYLVFPRAGVVVIGCVLAAAAIFILDGAMFLAGSLVLSAIVAVFTPKDRLQTLFFSLVAIGASGTLLYWKFDEAHKSTIETVSLGIFFVVAAAISLVSLLPGERSSRKTAIIALVIILFVAQHNFNQSVLNDLYSQIRHHWGAYIGPSETMLSGARILYDIPAQYGLGPTLLIASACASNCWIGMYWIAALAGVLYTLLIVAAASFAARKVVNPWAHGVILIAAALACMLWTSYPPSLAGPWSFPSTGGLRFIPLAGLVLFVLWRESFAPERRPWRLWGWLIWCLGSVWAPESAFYLTFVWWPYLLWGASNRSERPLRAAIFAGIEIIIVAAALVGAFVGAYYYVYGVVPSFDVYVAYVVNPTGPQPPNPLGSIWFFVFTIAAGIGAAALLARNKAASGEFASLFVCILALFAVFSYYIGRSHDNNILNLMPFLALMLAAVESFAIPALARGAHVALAATLACVMFFGWSSWRQTSLSDYANTELPASMSYIRGQTAEQSGAAAIPLSNADPGRQQAEPLERSRLDGANPADAARAVFYVSSERHEPLIKIDDGLDIAPIGPRAWTAIHDPIDFYFLPDALLAKMIDRTMRRLNSPGWMVIGKHVDADPWTLRWQRLIEASYAKTEDKDFGAYHAIRYQPKLQ